MVAEIVSDFTREKLVGSALIHRWYGRRGRSTALISLLLTANPELAVDKVALRDAAENPCEHESEIVKDLRVLDLCCGSGSLSEAALRLGAEVTAVDNHPIPVLMTRIALQYSQLFSTPSKDSIGCNTDNTWAGLGEEIIHWLNELIAEAKSQAKESWWPDVDMARCERVFQCPNCLTQIQSPSRRKSGSTTYELSDANTLECASCGKNFEKESLKQARIVLESISMTQNDAPDPEAITSCINSGFPDSLSDKLDDIWFESSRTRALLKLQDFCSPRQGRILVALRYAFRTIRDRLSDLNYHPFQAKALLESIALCLSNTLEYLSHTCTYDPRRKKLTGLISMRWEARNEYAEIGGSRLEAVIKKNGEQISGLLRDQPNGRKAVVTSMDMQDVDHLPGKYDIALWDPPYYDNIDYTGIARPWTIYLRSLLGDIDPLLPWDSMLSNTKRSFSEKCYQEKISETLKGINKVLNPGGKLGILWIRSGDSDQEPFGYLVDEATKHGLELIQSYSFVDSRSLPYTTKETRDQATCALIVFSRTVGPAIPADASRILLGVSEGRSMMYEGIVEILRDSLEHDEIECLIHDGYKGTQIQRLAETVMSSPNPIDLLRDVNRRDLRRYIQERGVDEADIGGKSADQLRRIVLQLLGWSIPSAPSFTIECSLEELATIEAEIRLVSSEEEIRGLATKSFDRIERILRFSVTTWANLVSPDDWKEPIRGITGKESRYTFGDWHRCLIEIPSKHAAQSEVAGRINRLLNKNKVQRSIEPLLKLRNTICHHDQTKENWSEIKRELLERLASCIDSLRNAYVDKALPLILLPEKETRDMYGRITLRLLSYSGIPYEFLMTCQTDLSQPVVVIACGSNPREVEPWLKGATELCSLASV